MNLTQYQEINISATDVICTKVCISMAITKKFRIKDSFQQLIGGIILSGPFVVTEEVWRIAENLEIIQMVLIVVLNWFIGYVALFEADKTRDVNVEQNVVGIPLRLISLILVAYLSVVLIVVMISPQATFGVQLRGTVGAVMICSIFSIVGAATADSVF